MIISIANPPAVVDAQDAVAIYKIAEHVREIFRRQASCPWWQEASKQEYAAEMRRMFPVELRASNQILLELRVRRPRVAQEFKLLMTVIVQAAKWSANLPDAHLLPQTNYIWKCHLDGTLAEKWAQAVSGSKTAA